MVNNPFKTLATFRGADKGVTRPATRTFLVILMLIVVLGLAIGAAVLGSKKGEATYEEQAPCACPEKIRRKCACPNKWDKGWKGFSIAVIALGIPMLVVFFLFFGCTMTKTTPPSRLTGLVAP